MNPKYNILLNNLNEQLNFIDLEIDDQIKKCEQAITIILKSINELKKLTAKNNFKSKSEEIMFFKEIKPLCLLHNSNIQKNLYKNRIFRKLFYARKEKIYPTIICIG